MGKFKVSKEKEIKLLSRMAELGIKEEELSEKFIRGSGPGGQKINKTSSCVYILHLPTGIEIKCQKDRSRAMNRFFARRELCERLAKQILGEKSAKQQQIEKIRRQKQRRSRKQKEKMLEEKRKKAKIKATRSSVRSEE